MGKRSRPLLAASEKPASRDNLDDEFANDVDDRDDIEEFVASRHQQMANKYGLDDSDTDDVGNEPEITEKDVLNIHTSDSDESSSDDSGILDAKDEEDEKDGEKGDWGGKRRNWYGGDTHEYEIMEDGEREEILQDEEEEAIHLQKKALHRMRPEDYLDDEDDDLQEDSDREDENQKEEAEPTTGLNISAPELDLLVREFERSFPQLSALKESSHWDEIDRIKYHLLGLFVTNVALYFSLRTDPDSVGTDLRTHPVLSRIVQIRALLRNAKSVLHGHAVKVAEEHGNGGREEDKKQANTKQPQNAHENEKDLVEAAETQPRQRKEKRKKRKRRSSEARDAIAADEERIQALLEPINHEAVVDDEQTIKEKKRRKLNKIVGAMERERKNTKGKRMVSADLDLVREDVRSPKSRTDNHDQVAEGYDESDLVDDDQVMKKMLAKREKKEARKARKAAASAPHVYTFNDEVHPDQKRKASSQVINNRGLTRFRPRDKKTPRTKNRLAYGKAVIRRKGAVREYTGAHGGSYGGEASGINISARKSSML